MPVQVKVVHRPRGLARLLYRLPIWLFRFHLGGLLMKRFLLLTHTGRKSGLPRRTVLEILRYEPAGARYIVLAGWGAQADWVKNVEKTPQVAIQVGNSSFEALARHVSPEESEDILVAYARRYPRLMRVLLRVLLGYRLDGTEEDVRDLARQSVLMAFDLLSPQSLSSTQMKQHA